MLSPQSQQAVDVLLRGEPLKFEAGAIGPLDAGTVSLLRVIVTNFDALSGQSGPPQADELRRLYSEELKRMTGVEPCKTQKSIPNRTAVTMPCWRLVKLKCQSIRGLTPFGSQFEFDFAGKSNLIYGPNGSGKSSLLGAVSWVLHGIPVTDADEQKHTASIYSHSKTGDPPTKIMDWPVMAALPSAAEPSADIPEHWSHIELHEHGDSRVLHLRRDGTGALLASTDGNTWNPCGDLAVYGIKPLDLQLSLVASTTFGRRNLEAAEDARSILSLMLGFDDLEQVGDLVTNLKNNRTRLQNSEQNAVNELKKELCDKLGAIPGPFARDHPLRPDLDALALPAGPTSEQIANAAAKTKAAITHAEKDLADVLGITAEENEVPTNLADKLISAITAIERGIWHCFPSLGAMRLEMVFPAKGSVSPGAQLIAIEEHLAKFREEARERIAKRYDWWLKETAPGSKASLLIKAAIHYDPQMQQCPVCDQSVRDLPVRTALEQLKAADPQLVQDVETLFVDLFEKLTRIVPTSLRELPGKMPVTRLREDWHRLRNEAVGVDLVAIAAKYDKPVETLIADLKAVDVEQPGLFPTNTDQKFIELGSNFNDNLKRVHCAIAMVRWGIDHLANVETRLKAITSDHGREPLSLLASLCKGKQAANDIQPLKGVLTELGRASTCHQRIDNGQTNLDILGEMQNALDALKDLRKYAVAKVADVFARIGDKTIENWLLLYPENAGLGPGRLDMGKGKNNKTIEARLSADGSYEVSSQYFANASLRRAITLAFYFALLADHPRGLGFIIMDDPILSLDDDHRETWSHELLKPQMKHFQFLVGTHQREYLNNCRHHFSDGQTVELIARQRAGPVAWRPGKRLERANEELQQGKSTNAPNEMRKYREELFAALQLYTPTPMRLNTDIYAALPPHNPLANKNRDKIVKAFRDPAVANVLDAGSHARTEADVTTTMVWTCLRQMQELDIIVVHEFDRLDEELQLSRSTLRIIAPVRGLFRGDTLNAIAFPKVPLIGRAAAQSDGYVINDGGARPVSCCLDIDVGILATSDSLEPLCKKGQWILLADASNMPHDGDLVAVEDTNGNRYLRRAWSDHARWILHAVNPVFDISAVVVRKDTPIQKVVGVLYEPSRSPGGTQSGNFEWQPRSDFDPGWLRDVCLLRVEGDSLNPIARRGQYVILGPKETANDAKILPGMLAAVEPNDETFGQVIKCVFVWEKHRLLTSRNPVEAIAPLVVPSESVKALWPVRGVLFADAVHELD